jgi:glutathione S-transferase
MTTRSSNTNEMLTLWGTPHSLYTGKVRSYLIKKGLSYREMFPSNPRFEDEIVSKMRLLVIPAVQTPSGGVLQDSTAIIDELERVFPDRPMVPTTPVQSAMAHLLDAFGTQAMLPAAMHYRWSYRAEQEHFLRAEFGRAVHQGSSVEERLSAGTEFMDYFDSYLPHLGVYPETIPVVEAAHEALLDALDIHFQHHPYLLGGCPSIADFGFMAPLYAHLARDPVPAGLMKQRAPNVYRWTERMNQAATSDGEFSDHDEAWYPNDAIPPSLEAILKLLFEDWGAQLIADAGFTNSWMEENSDLPVGHQLARDGDRTTHPTLGTFSYEWRGVIVERGSMPYGLWHLERAINAASKINGAAKQQFDNLVERLGGSEVMKIQLVRPFIREDYVLTLG